MEPVLNPRPAAGSPSVTLPADPAAQNIQNPWLVQVPFTSAALQNFRNFLVASSADYREITGGHLETSAQSGDGRFVAFAGDPRTAQRVADEASRIWTRLGTALMHGKAPELTDPIHICAVEGKGVTARGNNTISYRDGALCKGIIACGSETDILYSTLPHEMTHVMLGLGLKHDTKPWANEGMAMLSEHSSHQAIYQKNIENLLRNGKTMKAEELFSVTNGAPVPLPVYFQGFSYCQYLTARGEQIENRERDGERLTGKERLLKFVERISGADTTPEKMNGALLELYGFKNTAEFDRSWQAWVQGGRRMRVDSLLRTEDSAGGTSRMFDPSVPAIKLPPASQ